MQEEARAQKRLALRSHQLREAVVATKGEVRSARGIARRQQAALAGARRWHEGALRAQAQEFSETKSHAEATSRENVRCADLDAVQRGHRQCVDCPH